MKGCRLQECKVPAPFLLGIFIILWIFVYLHFVINPIENKIEVTDISGKCDFIRQISIPLSHTNHWWIQGEGCVGHAHPAWSTFFSFMQFWKKK